MQVYVQQGRQVIAANHGYCCLRNRSNQSPESWRGHVKTWLAKMGNCHQRLAWCLKMADTLGVVERPRGRNIVKNKWIFRIKKDDAGKIEHYKACLVAKGFTQVHGFDYYDTWAPVTKLAYICLLLAIAAQNNWTINMFDFHNTFLNGKLDSDEEVFMEQPLGHEQSDRKQYVCKLYKSLYGLKQAGHKWYNALCRTLSEIKFRWSSADPAVFYVHQGTDIVVLVCHIDDCTITGSSHDLVQSYKDKLKGRYSLTDLGAVKWLLGIKITWDLEARTVTLSQSSYINSILMRFNFVDLKLFTRAAHCHHMLWYMAELLQVWYPYRETFRILRTCVSGPLQCMACMAVTSLNFL